MNKALSALALLGLAFACPAKADLVPLYNNTTTDTGDTVFYSVGPYDALGDEITLIAPGTATEADVELYNNGAAGSFDAELDLFEPGSPVGASLGSFSMTDIVSVGSDVLDLSFTLGSGVAVPQDLIFTVSVANTSPGMDLGVDLFQPPTVGYSDPSYLIAESGGTYSQVPTADENVYFRLIGTPAPESSSAALLAFGLLAVGVIEALRRRLLRRRT